MKPLSLVRCLYVGLIAFSSTVLGHGGVSMEDDVCLITIGNYQAHFTGYLPKERATEEFCEDIPVATESIFVLDFISDELRDMELDFRIVRDVNKVGRKATYEDLGGAEAVEKATIYYQEPQQFHKGIIKANYTFIQEDQYVGIVNAHSVETGIKYRSVFPFTVGKINYGKYIRSYLALFVVCGIFIYMSGRNTVFKRKAK